MTPKKKNDSNCWIGLLILIIIGGIIALAVLFWYVVVPLLILSIYIFYRIKVGFSKSKYSFKLLYLFLIAPFGFIITSLSFLFIQGYNFSNFEVYLPIWGISALIWFIVPTFGIIYPKIRDIRYTKKEKKMEIRIRKKPTILCKYCGAETPIKVNYCVMCGKSIKKQVFYQKKERIKKIEAAEKERLKKIEATKFENMIKRAKNLINKSKRLFSKKAFELAFEKWKEAINSLNLTVEKADKLDDKALKLLREDICNLYIKFLLIDCTLTKGFSVIIQDNKIITKPKLGLNIFLAKWLENRGDE